MSESYATRHARRVKHRDYIRAKKLASGCVECGYRANAERLHWHHRDPKQKVCKVSDLISYSIARIDIELAKCEVRCEACHYDTPSYGRRR